MSTTVISLGARFAKWGLGFFVFGVFLVFGIIGHYCIGANHPTGHQFMENITLWWACPWTLSVATLQLGGLGMVALGLTEIVGTRLSVGRNHASVTTTPLFLCIAGLFGVFAVGYPGYFVFDAIWPSFYYSPVPQGKNAWLLGQALFIAVYLLGALPMFNNARRTINLVSTAAT